jgi:hypothetical protein
MLAHLEIKGLRHLIISSILSGQLILQGELVLQKALLNHLVQLLHGVY